MSANEHSRTGIALQKLERWLSQCSLIEGDALPPQRELAATIGVSRDSLTKAIGVLQGKGVLISRQGSGTYLARKPLSFLPASVADGGLKIKAEGESPRPLGILLLNTWSRVSRLMLSGFSSKARELGRDIAIAESNYIISKQSDGLMKLLAQRVEGVAYFNMHGTPHEHVIALQQMGIPVVLLGAPIDGITAPLIRPKLEVVADAYVSLLRSHGHRHIAAGPVGLTPEWNVLLDLIRSAPDIEMPESRTLDFGSEEPPLVARTERIKQFVKTCLAEDNPPTAFLTVVDSLAHELTWALNDMGLSVPEDVSIVTLGTKERDGDSQHLAAVTYDVRWSAAQSVELLGRMISGELPIESPIWMTPEIGTSPSDSLAMLGAGAAEPPRSDDAPAPGHAKSRGRGFTLVELLVVVAVIGLLIALLFPALRSAMHAAGRMVCMSNQRQIGIAHATYVSDHDLVPSPFFRRGGHINFKSWKSMGGMTDHPDGAPNKYLPESERTLNPYMYSDIVFEVWDFETQGFFVSGPTIPEDERTPREGWRCPADEEITGGTADGSIRVETFIEGVTSPYEAFGSSYAFNYIPWANIPFRDINGPTYEDMSIQRSREVGRRMTPSRLVAFGDAIAMVPMIDDQVIDESDNRAFLADSGTHGTSNDHNLLFYDGHVSVVKVTDEILAESLEREYLRRGNRVFPRNISPFGPTFEFDLPGNYPRPE